MSRYQVKCRRCRHWLMSEDSIVDCHGNKVQGDLTNWDCGGQLGESTHTHLFVSCEDAPPFVMDPIVESSYTQGKILCPKCSGRLGSFDFLRTTRSCPCRLTTLPPVHLLHDRLDLLDCRQRHQHIVSPEDRPNDAYPDVVETSAGLLVDEKLEKRGEFMCTEVKLNKQMDLLHKDVDEQLRKRADLVFIATDENLDATTAKSANDDSKDLRSRNVSSVFGHFSDVDSANLERNDRLVNVSSLSEHKTEGTDFCETTSQTSADLEHNKDRKFNEESCLHLCKSCLQSCDCIHTPKSQPSGLAHTQVVNVAHSENCGQTVRQNTADIDSTKTVVQPDIADETGMKRTTTTQKETTLNGRITSNLPTHNDTPQFRKFDNHGSLSAQNKTFFNGRVSNNFSTQDETSHVSQFDDLAKQTTQSELVQGKKFDEDLATQTTQSQSSLSGQIHVDLATHIMQNETSQNRADSKELALQVPSELLETKSEKSNPQNDLLQVGQVDGDFATHTALNETSQIEQIPNVLTTQTSTMSNCAAPLASNPQSKLLQVSDNLATQISRDSNGAMLLNSDPIDNIDELLQVTQVSTDIATQTSTNPNGATASNSNSIVNNANLNQISSLGVNSGRFHALANLDSSLFTEDGDRFSESSHQISLPTSKKLIHKKPSRIIVSSSSAQRKKRVRRRRITDDDIYEDNMAEDVVSSSSTQQRKKRVRRRRLTDDNDNLDEEDSGDDSQSVGVDGNGDVSSGVMGVAKHGRYLRRSHHQREQEKRERQLTEERELAEETVLWDHSCPMCLEVMWKPHTTLPCRHHFCEACLRHLTSSTSSTRSDCPLCRQRIAQCLPNAELEETILKEYPAHIRIRQRDHRRNQRYKHTPLPGLGFPHNVLSRLPRNASLSSTCKRRVMMVMLNMVIVAALSYIGMAICGKVLRYLADFYDSVTERLTGERLWSGFMGLESRVLTASCVFVLYLVCACMTHYFRLFQHIQN